MTADPLNLAALTVEQRDAVMTPWWEVAKAEDWDSDADQLYWSAVDALAWTLVDGSMDTADREPSAECVQQARATAERMLLAGARLDLAERVTAAEAAHRDLVRRLGFGDNITEAMADNDTVVAWFEERVRALADEFESTGDRLQGVPAAQTWLLVSARLRAALDPAPASEVRDDDKGAGQ